MSAKTERKCLDCGAILTGHDKKIKRCRNCAARQRYFERFGKPPERIISKCEVCDKEFSDYASSRRKHKDGVYFCSPECRAAWVGVKNSVSRGGDGMRKPKDEKDANYYRRNSDEIRTKRKQFYQDNRETILNKKREETRKIKETVLFHYGGKCECCGETLIEFLTIDHLNNNGAEHRRIIGNTLYKNIIENNFPENQYRVLCFNCNVTRGFYGYCPHKPEEKREISHRPFNPGRRRTVK